MQRLEGYRQSVKEAGCQKPALEWLSAEPSSLTLGGRLLERHFKVHPEVDAIFFCNDDLAQGGLLATLRLGIQVPQRIAIASFNDLSGSDQMYPPLTTIRTSRVVIGERAADMLLKLMQGKSVEQACVNVGWQLVLRQSN